MNERAKQFDMRSETREETITRLKGDIWDRIEEALDNLVTQAMHTKESQSLSITVALKNKKGEWTSETKAAATINYGKTTRKANEIGGQLALHGVLYD